MTWEQLKADFTANIQQVYAAAYQRLSGAIEARPEAFRDRVTSFLDALATTKANLDRIAAKLPNPPKDKAEAGLITRYAEMKQLYDALVAGISENATRVNPSEVGWGPVAVILVIGVVGLSIAGVAWAVAAWEYAASLRDQSGFMDRELDARVEAMRSGAQLPATTAIPPSASSPPDPTKGAGGSGINLAWLLGGLALAGAAAVFVVPKLGAKG